MASRTLRQLILKAVHGSGGRRVNHAVSSIADVVAHHGDAQGLSRAQPRSPRSGRRQPTLDGPEHRLHTSLVSDGQLACVATSKRIARHPKRNRTRERRAISRAGRCHSCRGTTGEAG